MTKTKAKQKQKRAVTILSSLGDPILSIFFFSVPKGISEAHNEM